MKTAIISDGLAGFMLAHVLTKMGHSVTLIDTNQNPQSESRFCDFGIHFLPNTPLVRHGLTLLENCFETSFDIQAIPAAPFTVEDNKLKNFIGFGEGRSKAVEALSFFNAPSRLAINVRESDLVQLALQTGEFKILPFSELSALKFESLAQNSRIENVTLNGQTDLAADQFIYLNAPQDLLALIPQELLGVRTRSRISKVTSWARVSLKLTHVSPLPEFSGQVLDELIFLMPNQPDHQPCVGQFAPLGTLQSCWQTYILAELAEDTVYVSNSIKEIRKLVRKAFSVPDTTTKESVIVDLLATSDLAWIFDNKEVMNLAENFVFAPRLASQSHGLAQSVECLSRAFDALFASSVHAEVDNTSPRLLQHP